jgi:hypothetical protein
MTEIPYPAPYPPTMFINSAGSLVPVDSVGNSLPVNASVSISPTSLQNVNITQLGSAAIVAGATTAAHSLPVAIATDQTIAVTGSFAAAALQNVNITQFGSVAIGQGQTTMLHSMPVVIASDQSTIPVSGTISVNGGTVAIGGAVTLAGTSPVSIGTSGSVVINPGTNTIGFTVDALNTGYVIGTSAEFDQFSTINGTAAVTAVAAFSGLHGNILDLLAFRTDAGTAMATITLNVANSLQIPLPPSGGASPPVRIPIKSNGTNVAITYTSQVGITGFVRAAGFSGT